MERTVLSADEIRKRVQKLVNAIPEVMDDEAKIEIPQPKLHEVDRTVAIGIWVAFAAAQTTKPRYAKRWNMCASASISQRNKTSDADHIFLAPQSPGRENNGQACGQD